MKRHARSVLELVQETFGDEPTIGVEVGVWRGHTSHALLSNLPNLFLWLVDLYDDKDLFRSEVESMAEALAEARSLLSDYSSRSKWILDDSISASTEFEDGSIDWVFIDADHKYQSVVEDILAWSPRVRSGGLVIGHDYEGQGDRTGKFGVKRAVDEWIERNQLQLAIRPGLVWCYQVP